MIEKYSFLTKIMDKKHNEDILCLIQIVSKNYISFYNVNLLKEADFADFFNMVNVWWQKEPTIPVSLYYKDRFLKFNYILQHISVNDFQYIDGFEGINLKNMLEKRIKRKVINLLK